MSTPSSSPLDDANVWQGFVAMISNSKCPSNGSNPVCQALTSSQSLQDFTRNLKKITHSDLVNYFKSVGTSDGLTNDSIQFLMLLNTIFGTLGLTKDQQLQLYQLKTWVANHYYKALVNSGIVNLTDSDLKTIHESLLRTTSGSAYPSLTWPYYVVGAIMVFIIGIVIGHIRCKTKKSN